MGNAYLSAPLKEKEAVDGENGTCRYAGSSMNGWPRCMEDFYLVEGHLAPDAALFAVFDGHGGAGVARFCMDHFCRTFRKTREFCDGQFEEALKKTFLLLDEAIISPEGQRLIGGYPGEMPFSPQLGTTAIVVFMKGRTVYTANAGDSRSVLFRDARITRLSEDHKPDNDIEKQRISNAGGFIIDGRVNGNLNLSRAIGDFGYKSNVRLQADQQLIVAVPDVTKVELKEGEKAFLLLASDGIWNVHSEEFICQFIDEKLKQNQKPSSVLGALFDTCLAEDIYNGIGCDNMSAVLVEFK